MTVRLLQVIPAASSNLQVGGGDAGCKGGTPLYGEKGLLTSRDNSELWELTENLWSLTANG